MHHFFPPSPIGSSSQDTLVSIASVAERQIYDPCHVFKNVRFGAHCRAVVYVSGLQSVHVQQIFTEWCVDVMRAVALFLNQTTLEYVILSYLKRVCGFSLLLESVVTRFNNRTVYVYYR